MDACFQEDAVTDLNARLAQAHIERGFSHYRSGDYRDCLMEMDMAKCLLPNDPYVNYLIGRAHLKLKALKNAQQAFRKALAVCARFVDAQYQLGRTYLMMGRRHLREAQSCFEQEIRNYPSHARAHHALSKVHSARGQVQEAHRFAVMAEQFGYRSFLRLEK